VEQNEVIRKASGAVFKGIKVAWAWCVSFVKIRVYKLRLRVAKRELDGRTARLGMEFYSLYRRGETEILNSVVIAQQLKIVEEAESQVLDLQSRIDAVHEEYRKKKDAISAQA
jgi:hypothetical protein